MKRIKLGQPAKLADLRANAVAQGYRLVLDAYWGVAEEVKAAEAGKVLVAVYADEDHGALEVYALDAKGGGMMIGHMADQNLIIARGKWKVRI